MPTLERVTLEQQIIDLGPWHLDIELTAEISMAVSVRDEKVPFASPKRWFVRELGKIYPDGLAGKQLPGLRVQLRRLLLLGEGTGAAECFGFDVRQRWIDQARFLLANREYPNEGIRFERLNLVDLPALGLQPFDITWFSGIFYHLPRSDRRLEDRRRPDARSPAGEHGVAQAGPKGALLANRESKDLPLSGVDGFAWFPTGTEVLESILRAWLGFVEFRVSFQNDHRLALWASKINGLLSSAPARN